MTDKVDLFKLLLKKEYYNLYSHRVDREIFPEVLHDLYDSLDSAHKDTAADVTCRGVWNIHLTRNPTLTEANQNVVKEVLKDVSEAEEIDTELAEVVVNRSLIELKAKRIAEAALSIAHGHSDDFSELTDLLNVDTNAPDLTFVTTNVAELMDDIQSTYRWHFNLDGLDRLIGKIGPEVFGIIAAPVNAGKSLVGISFVFGPDGFASQGAKCMYIGNEESLRRTMIRGISCYTGMTRDEIADDYEKAQESFNEIKENIIMIDDLSMNMNKLDRVLEKHKPDVVILDMLDKINISGSFQRDDQRLGKIAQSARELAKKHQCVVLGMSQTNAESFGKLNIDQNELVGSRVDKAANCDLLLTLGAMNSDDAGEANFRRINIAKSKFGGNGEKVNCAIIPELSRLVS